MDAPELYKDTIFVCNTNCLVLLFVGTKYGRFVSLLKICKRYQWESISG